MNPLRGSGAETISECLPLETRASLWPACIFLSLSPFAGRVSVRTSTSNLSSSDPGRLTSPRVKTDESGGLGYITFGESLAP